MSCELVCVRIFRSIVGVVAVECILLLLYFLDEDMQEYKWSTWCFVGAMLELAGSVCLYSVYQQDYRVSLGCFCINLYLAVSTSMDIMLKRVTDIIHYLGLTGGMILIFQTPPQPEVCKELMVYTIIQYFIFGRMYGRADVIGFVLCALFFATTGRGIGTYVGHMSLSFGILALVQAFRQNIASDGNLKQSVALFPYMFCSFLLII